MFAAVVILCAGRLLGAAPTTQQAAIADEAASMTFLQLLIKGGWFMIPIGMVSLIGLALIMERLVALRMSRVVPGRFLRGMKAAGRDVRAAIEYCRGHDSPIARIVGAGLRKLPHGEEAARRAIEDAGVNEVHKLRRNLRLLFGVSAVAPMLGLIGTVWGMIEAFRVTAAARGLGRPELLAKGIYEALVTTLGGLIVAIPVLMFYYYFVGKIEQIISVMNDVSEEALEQFTGVNVTTENMDKR